MTGQLNYYKRRLEDIEFDILAELAKLHDAKEKPIKSQALARRLAHPYRSGLEKVVAARLRILSKKGYVQGNSTEREPTGRSDYPPQDWEITQKGIDWVKGRI